MGFRRESPFTQQGNLPHPLCCPVSFEWASSTRTRFQATRCRGLGLP
jgi:hypothetical protein